MLHQTFPFTHWLSSILKPGTPLSPHLPTRRFVHMSYYNCFLMSHAPIFLYGSNFVSPLRRGYTTDYSLAQSGVHRRPRPWKKANLWGSMTTATYSNYSLNKRLRQSERHRDIKCLMCQEDTMISSRSIRVRKPKWNIINSECLKILYNWIFRSIFLKRYRWHLPHYSNQKSDFWAKRELI